MQAMTLPGDLLAQLGVMSRGDNNEAPPTLVTLGDTVKFDGAFPGEKSEWTKWDQGVEALIRKNESEGKRIVYELWKEPDNGRPFKDRVDFFSAFVHTTRKIRKFAPETVLLGPSTLKFDHGWISEFLKVCKEYDVLPPIVCWHEDGLKHDLSGHIGSLAESFWQDGTNLNRIIVSPNAQIDGKESPSDPAIFLGQMERSIKSNAYQHINQNFEFKLTHLFTNDQKPRSNFFAYQQYAVMEGMSMKVNGSGTVDGVAVWNAKTRSGKLLLGRNRTRVDNKQVLGAVTLQLKAAAGSDVRLIAKRLADSGAKASNGFEKPVESDLPIKNGEVSILLPGFATGDAYLIEFTIRGEAPATRPASGPATMIAATQSTTTTAKKNENSR